MNPAALKSNLGELPAGGALIVNEDAFTAQNLQKVGYASNPLTDGSLKQWNVFNVPISTLNTPRARGPRPDEQAGRPDQELLRARADVLAVRARSGRARSPGSTTSSRSDRRSPRATSAPSTPATTSARRPRSSTSATSSRRPSSPPGHYRNITGNEATALGFVAASQLAGRDLFYGSYPITPASDILHQLAGYKNFGVKTFQAEDEIAAIGAAIGASYGGAMGMTASSGPGHRAQERGPRARGDGRAAARRRRRAARRPVHRHADEDRAGRPAPGAVRAQLGFARCAVVAPATPGECFQFSIEAWRLALKYMTPVVYLSDAFLATGAEPWRIPERRRPAVDRRARTAPSARASIRTCATRRPSPGRGPCPARPASSTGSAASRRPTSWATSATTRRTTTGCSCSARPRSRASPPTSRRSRCYGPPEGDLLILGWGSTYGAIRSAVERLQATRRLDRPRPPALPQPVPGEHRRRPAGLQARPDPGGQPRPALDADPGAAT